MKSSFLKIITTWFCSWVLLNMPAASRIKRLTRKRCRICASPASGALAFVVAGVAAPDFARRPDKPWEGVDYFGGGNLALQGGRWFDALSSRAVIDNGLSVAAEHDFMAGGFPAGTPSQHGIGRYTDCSYHRLGLAGLQGNIKQSYFAQSVLRRHAPAAVDR